MTRTPPVPTDQIAATIYVVRGHRVMLDADLAVLYGVPTGRLNEQVTRQGGRFPGDFAFRLTAEEATNLISQIAISSGQWGGRRKLPMVFTEHGAVMLASVLRSQVERKYDGQFKVVFQAIRDLMAPPAPVRKRIGFHPESGDR